MPLFSLSNAWQVQAPPGDSNGTGDCCCGGPPGAQRAVGCQQVLGSLYQLPTSLPAHFNKQLGGNWCQEWVPGQVSGSQGEHRWQHLWISPWTIRSMASTSPTPSELLKSPGKSKRVRECSIHSWCLFKALIPAQMSPALCVPTAPSCPEETKPRAIAKASSAHLKHCN